MRASARITNTQRASVESAFSGLVSGEARRTQVAVLFPARGLLLRLGLRGRACFGSCCLSLLFLRRHLILLDRRVRCSWLDAIRQPLPPRPHEFVASEARRSDRRIHAPTVRTRRPYRRPRRASRQSSSLSRAPPVAKPSQNAETHGCGARSKCSDARTTLAGHTPKMLMS